MDYLADTVALVRYMEQVVVAAASIDDVRELHDRIIAGTAKHLNIPILTGDQILVRSKHITALWQ
jgi:hypothetical protein